jgi:hypothetical protein
MNKAEALKVEPGQLIAQKGSKRYQAAYYGVPCKMIRYHENVESFEIEYGDGLCYGFYYALRQPNDLPRRVLIRHRDAVVVTEEMMRDEEYKTACTVYGDAKSRILRLVKEAFTRYAIDVRAVLANRMALVAPLIKVSTVDVDYNLDACGDLDEVKLNVTLRLPLDVTATMFSWINAENAMTAKVTDKDSWELPSKHDVCILLEESEAYKLAVEEYHAARARYVQAAAQLGIVEGSIAFQSSLRFIKT